MEQPQAQLLAPQPKGGQGTLSPSSLSSGSRFRPLLPWAYGRIHRALECPGKVLPVSADCPEKEAEFLRAGSHDLGREDLWGQDRSRLHPGALRASRGHRALLLRAAPPGPDEGGWRQHAARRQPGAGFGRHGKGGRGQKQ